MAECDPSEHLNKKQKIEQFNDHEHNDIDFTESDQTFSQMDHSYAETQTRRYSSDVLHSVVISSNEVNIAKTHPIKLKNELSQLLGNIQTIKIHNSNILLKLNDEQMRTMQQTKKLLNYTIQSKVIENHQKVKGIIHGVSLDITTDEITDLLESYNVTSAVRLGKKQNTESVILTFSSKTLPQSVTIGFKTHKVKTYIPLPTRCFNCHKYGHTSTYCRTKTICPNCSGNHHYSDCQNSEKKCPNCGDCHNAAYKGCQEFKNAQNITKYKTINNTTYTQAKKEIQQQKSYAQIVKTTKPNQQSPIYYQSTRQTTQESSVNLHPFKSNEMETNTEQEIDAELDIENQKTTLPSQNTQETKKDIYTFIITTSAIMASPMNDSAKAKAIAALARIVLDVHVQEEIIEETFQNHDNLYNYFDMYGAD